MINEFDEENDMPLGNECRNIVDPADPRRQPPTVAAVVPKAPYVSNVPTPAAPHPLEIAFNAAIDQAKNGKGMRHGGDSVPFCEQSWYRLAKTYGINGLLFQAAKKMGESLSKESKEDFERELLGAIVYAGMAYIYVQREGFHGCKNKP